MSTQPVNYQQLFNTNGQFRENWKLKDAFSEERNYETPPDNGVQLIGLGDRIFSLFTIPDNNSKTLESWDDNYTGEISYLETSYDKFGRALNTTIYDQDGIAQEYREYLYNDHDYLADEEKIDYDCNGEFDEITQTIRKNDEMWSYIQISSEKNGFFDDKTVEKGDWIYTPDNYKDILNYYQ